MMTDLQIYAWGAGGNVAEKVPEGALYLQDATQRITPEEFGWQESHYDHDSQHGRELLFLIANDEWIRATSEIVDVSRSDAVDTTIKVDIELDQITHEAFRDRIGRFWLPVILLPPEAAEEQPEAAKEQAAEEQPEAAKEQAAEEQPEAAKEQQSPRQQSPQPDPFATVTDATGGLLPMLPMADIRHQISAALAEIMINMAVARWSGEGKQPPVATRDQRLVLSAAIYRLLRRGTARGFYASPSSQTFDAVTPGKKVTRTVHLVNAGTADVKVSDLTQPTESFTVADLSNITVRPGESITATVTYAPTKVGNASSPFTICTSAGEITVNLSATAEDQPLTRLDQAKKDLDELFNPYIEPSNEPSDSTARRAAALELTRRAVKILEAFAESVVVVVPVDRRSTPAVLTVRVPARGMVQDQWWRIQHLRRKSASAWIRERLAYLTWILQPLGHLQIHVLLPLADADRHVQVNLPDGVFIDRTGTARSSLEIQVEPPQPLKNLRLLIRQLLDPNTKRREAVSQCLADLARAKAAATRETLRLHDTAHAEPATSDAAAQPATGDAHTEPAETNAHANLDRMIAELKKLSDEQPINAVETELCTTRDEFDDATSRLFRRTFVDDSSPRTVMARADAIEDVSQRASPTNAKVDVHVQVSDQEYFSIARFSGRMSLLLMILVLIFFPIAHFSGYDTSHPAAEVLAIVLTLFSAHLATRIERPDRSTLRGLLSAGGNWLIVASIMPTITLAVVLAFSPSWVWAMFWAALCIGLQLLLQIAMSRGRKSVKGSWELVRPLKFHTKEVDYRHSDALRSDWWRGTTADALMIGRKAYAYVVWQEGSSATLTELLKHAQRRRPHRSPANVLALLRSGTADQTVTFAVFREEPPRNWAGPNQRELDLDPDRLAPLEQVNSTVDVFLGIPRECGLHVLANHPLQDILLEAQENRLIVLEIQLPMPAPVAVKPPCHWARIRVALRDADISRLGPFLADIAGTADKHRKSMKLVVAAQVVPSDEPRMITGSKQNGKILPVLATDMDVLTLAADKGESSSACNWRILAICADARSGIEYDIIKKLGEKRDQLQLAGLTYGLLHGTAVVLLLGHDPAGDIMQNGDPCLEHDLIEHDGSLAKLHVLVNRWRSREQLGHVKMDPLLQVRLRAPDRPGALLDVLDSLSQALHDKLSDAHGRVWHANTRVTGHAAFTRLTIRLDTAAPTVMDRQGKGIFDEIQRTVRSLMARDAAAAHNAESHPDYELESAEDPVISVDLIRAPSIK